MLLDGLLRSFQSDPGTVPVDRAPDAKVPVASHPTAMWALEGPEDRAVYVGEAHACWVWAVLWPASDGFLLIALVFTLGFVMMIRVKKLALVLSGIDAVLGR